jgi:hypothetical protein
MLMATAGLTGGQKMPGWAIIILFIAAYFVLMRWVLPKLGVQT